MDPEERISAEDALQHPFIKVNMKMQKSPLKNRSKNFGSPLKQSNKEGIYYGSSYKSPLKQS
jgi:hypothetical protein